MYLWHWSLETVLSYLPSQKARQVILTPKSPSICIYVRHSQLRTPCLWPRNRICSYLMASSFSRYLYNILNSRFRLLRIVHCTCGGQFCNQLRQVSAPFSAPGPRQIPTCPQGSWAKWCQLPGNWAWLCQRLWGWKPFNCAIAGCPCVLY